MEQLLPYYESELAYLRRNLRDFAERYPKIAGRLLISGEVCEDPHTERMIESFALLNARIAKRLDDDYPEFTEALFEVLYPHYLRPFPSCSIARMDVAAAARQQTAASMIARGTQLTSRPVRGGVLRLGASRLLDAVLQGGRLQHGVEVDRFFRQAGHQKGGDREAEAVNGFLAQLQRRLHVAQAWFVAGDGLFDAAADGGAVGRAGQGTIGEVAQAIAHHRAAAFGEGLQRFLVEDGAGVEQRFKVARDYVLQILGSQSRFPLRHAQQAVE